MQRLKTFAITIAVLTLLVFPFTTSSHNHELAPERPVEPKGSATARARFMRTKKPIPNRYIVVLEDDVVPDNASVEVRRGRIAAIARGHAQTHRGTVDFIYETALKGFAIQLPNEAAARAISNSPGVRWVEEDGYGEWDQAPASPQPSPPWGLDAIDGQMPAPQPNFSTGRTNGFYGFGSTGTGVTAYVLDSGINTQHQEFMTPFFSRASQAADCFDFVNCQGGTLTPFHNQEACVFPMPNASNNDCHGHGTAVASVVGGNQFGVAKNVTIKSVKVGSTNGVILSAAIAGVNWVTGQASPSIPAVATMNTALPTSAGVETAVTNSLNAGVTYAVAAGNTNSCMGNVAPNCIGNQSPANVPGALTIGAVDWNGNRPSFSNWGPGVDLFAPGVTIVTALTGNFLCSWDGSNSATCIVSGTSFAAPHVAGAVAMYLQGRPGQTSCGPNPIQGQAPPSGNVSGCPDRVSRFLIANARRDVLTSTINGSLPSPNRFLTVLALPGPANPIENNQFFVWSQYVDFLNREPDSHGFGTWTFNLNQCSPSDWPCLNAQRIHAVRGFIESGEFKQGKPALENPTSTAQYNEEYVRQLYLCLLRRQPDAGGFSNWVTFLNSTGDYSHVVHGFINSTEYRRRFGPQ